MLKVHHCLLRWLNSLSYHQIVLCGLGLGVLLSLTMFVSALHHEHIYSIANFHLAARTAAATVQETLDYGVHDFAAARSFYRASSTVTREEFNRFVNFQLAANPLPGLMALEWIPYVTTADRLHYEQVARAEGFEDFVITERSQKGQLVRAGTRNEYYPVYYVASQTEMEYILGFDLGSNAAQRAAMERARDSGLPTASGPVVLVQSPNQTKGAFIFLPIYNNGAEPATVAERREQLHGFLLGIFDLHTLLTGQLKTESAAAYDLYLADPSLPPAEQLLFFHPARSPDRPDTASPNRAPSVTLEQLRSGIYYQQAIEIAEENWWLIITPAANQLAAAFSPLPLATLFVTLAFSILATAYVARRRQVRDLLQQSEEQYRLVVENISDVIWAVDATSMKPQFVTPSVAKLRGFTAEETLQQSYEQILAPEFVAPVRAFVAQSQAAAASGFTGPYIDELAVLRRDGSLVWTETICHFAVDPQTQRVQIYGSSRDITERRRTARTQAAQFAVSRILAQSPNQATGIVQVLESLTVSLDWLGAEFWQRSADGSRLEWCAGWCKPEQPAVAHFLHQSKAYTYTPGQGLVGRTWQENRAYWENNITSYAEYPRHAIAKAAGLQSAVSVPVCIDDETLGVMVFHDSSARPVDDWLLETLVDLGRQIGQFIVRKRAEVELHEERILLAQRVQERTADLRMVNAELAQAVSAKDEFLANMSHELRTPLNGILTLAESLQEGTYGPLTSRQQQPLTLITQSGDHLLALINDILDLSKVAAGKLDIHPEFISAFAICQASMALMQEMAGKKSIQLALQSNDSGAWLRADPRRLKQILVNLLGNAIKFTPAGGHILLSATVQPEAGIIEFAVQDDGIGIPPAEQARLFQPFTQLDASLNRHYEGTGLGLALVRRLVELHHGQVRVESTGVNGQGSRFIVSLPWEDDAAPDLLAFQERSAGLLQNGSGPALAAHNRWASLDRNKILLADDNELNLLALRDYLTSAGFALSFASSGVEALRRAEEIEPDLILMDMQMPQMSGMEAIRHLRNNPRFAATPILALTALAMPGDREQCLAAGANDYIAKPFLLKDLVKTIHKWLAQTEPLPN